MSANYDYSNDDFIDTKDNNINKILNSFPVVKDEILKKVKHNLITNQNVG